MRFYYRTGRHSGIPMPLWVALLGYLFVGAAMTALVVAVAVTVATMVLILVAAALVAAAVGWVQRRHGLRE